ncbi:MAG: stage II sporulation protein P [Ignavibacteriales bacterium]
MPNITVFRVSSQKSLKKPLFYLLLWFVISMMFILIYITFFFDSVKYLESESIRFVRAANLKTLESVIFYSIPVCNTGSLNGKEPNKSANTLYLGIFDFKKILQGKYPVLSGYVPNSIRDKANNQNSNFNENSNEKNQVDENENKNSKIYSKTTLVKAGGILIRNHTKYKIDINKMLSEPLKFKTSQKGTSAIILHTHTTEAYMSNSKNAANGYRTNSPDENVTRVGLELKKQLNANKIKAFQDTTVHDYPEYLGAYSRAFKTILKNLGKYPEAKLVLDIHRDAYGETEGSLRTAVKINGSDTAKIMFVIGTDELGLEHKEWRENLKLAVKLQDKANKLYPGLCREIDLRKERFNQHSARGAIIVEVGGTGNNIIEAERSMKYLARIISDTFKTK